MARKQTSAASPGTRRGSASSATHTSGTSTAQVTRPGGAGKDATAGSRQYQGKATRNAVGAGARAYHRSMAQASLGSSEAQGARTGGIRSMLTTKSQTTLPRGVRDALHVGPGDELVYEIQGDVAMIRRAPPAGSADVDPVLLGFLDLIERDLAQHPGRARALPAALLTRMQRLAEAAGSIDPDERIDGAVAL